MINFNCSEASNCITYTNVTGVSDGKLQLSKHIQQYIYCIYSNCGPGILLFFFTQNQDKTIQIVPHYDII